MTRPFTGRHMALVMVGFFAVVIGVNVVMATAAVRTFGGSTVENSYVASQEFNGWLAQARAQRRLGWRVTPTVDAQGRLIATLDTPAGRLEGARVTVQADHPLGLAPSRQLVLRADGAGRYMADQPLPAGRWLLHLTVAANGHVARFEDEARR